MKLKPVWYGKKHGVYFRNCNTPAVYWMHINALRTMDWFLAGRKPEW